MLFPKVIDLTPTGRIVNRARIGSRGYIENIEYQLQIKRGSSQVSIDYIGEDGTALSDVCPNFVQQIKRLTKNG